MVIVTTSHDTPIPTTSLGITPRYHTGDIVDGTQNIDRTPHLIILDYNKTSEEYDYDIIFQNANKSCVMFNAARFLLLGIGIGCLYNEPAYSLFKGGQK